MVISGIQIVITGPIIRLEPSALSNNNQGRGSVKESYEKIFEDLDYAIKYRPQEFYFQIPWLCRNNSKGFQG